MSQETKNPMKIFIVMGGIVFLLWLAFALMLSYSGGCFTKTGPFGDSFGVISALFSGLAFAGMICTLIMQRDELSLQRQELKETREELKRTAEANEKSAKLAKENIEQQKNISITHNSYIKNQIAAQRYIAILEYYYKNIEYSEGAYLELLQKNDFNIRTILDKFLELKNINGPIIDDQTPRFITKCQSSSPRL